MSVQSRERCARGFADGDQFVEMTSVVYGPARLSDAERGARLRSYRERVLALEGAPVISGELSHLQALGPAG